MTSPALDPTSAPPRLEPVRQPRPTTEACDEDGALVPLGMGGGGGLGNGDGEKLPLLHGVATGLDSFDDKRRKTAS